MCLCMGPALENVVSKIMSFLLHVAVDVSFLKV
jgi:hypothetical protein